MGSFGKNDSEQFPTHLPNDAGNPSGEGCFTRVSEVMGCFRARKTSAYLMVLARLETHRYPQAFRLFQETVSRRQYTQPE